jgi:outer membrane protein assembly factor BamB/tetratricopeptide (TPR) repeat protein
MTVRALISEMPRPIFDVVAAAQTSGLTQTQTLEELTTQIKSKRLVVIKVATEKTREEELAAALGIEAAFKEFVNRLLCRTHLAAIYERIHENDKAADQYRGIADEHLAQDRVQEGMSALRDVLRLRPLDIGARELSVKVLRGLNKLGEAARESVDLARALIQLGLPGRAWAAYELALKFVPKSTGVLWMLATLLGRLGEKEEAVKRYEEIAQIARASGDEQGALAAYQQILEVDPANADALAQIRKISGYGRALAARWSSVAAGVLILLMVVGYATFEMRALAAYKETRKRAMEAVDQDKFDVAKSIAKEFLDRWDLSRFRSAGKALLERIDLEERTVANVHAWREARQARALEAAGNIPAAAEHWNNARSTDDARKRDDAVAGAARCEEQIAKGRQAVDEAERLLKRDSALGAYERLVKALKDSPWLKDTPDFKVPWRIETVPPGARGVLDGVALERPTPVVALHPVTSATLRLEARSRDPLEQRVEGVPPWPLSFVLPRRPAWTCADARDATGPVVAGELIVTGGRDRTVTAIARADGKTRWRNVDAFGVFGECHLQPVVVPECSMVVARADSGIVAGIDLETGETKWRLDLAPAPFDPVAVWSSRPVLAGTGSVVLRDGARGIVCLDARSGKQAWRTKGRSDIVGPPAIAGDLLAIVFERTVECASAKTGEQLWVARLPKAAIAGPVADPASTFYVALDSGAIAAIDKAGNLIATQKVAEPGMISTPLSASADRIVVGLSTGEVVALAPGGKKVLFRTTLDGARAISWVRSVDKTLVVAGDGITIRTIFGMGGEVWRHPAYREARPKVEGVFEPDAPATADESHVYAVTDQGLVALER